jgi:hypothetical protein
MKFTTASVFAVAAAGLAAAHMEMMDPPPFRSKFNKNVQNADYSMTSPLGVYPCKGYHSDFGTAEGASVASWAAGSQQKFTITGGAAHGGGSCQAALSYDNGATFKVIHSYIGNCPVNGESSYSFTVPAEAPGGDAIFAWTWFNNLGNREMYMNCAAVTITGSGSGLSALPDIFVANVAAAPGCTTADSTDLMFPNPGANVDNNSANAAAPVGDCGAAAAPPAPGNGDGGNAPAPTPEPTPEPTPVVTQAPPPVVSTPDAKPTNPGAPGGVFLPNPESSTLATVTKAPAATSSPAPPAQTPTVPVPVPEGAQSGACTVEGAWACIGGSQFQRCASGMWSAVQAMAGGTTCTPGVSSALNFVASPKKRSIRGIDRFAAVA